MRQVSICGLYQPDYTPDAVAELARVDGEIWTMNDWWLTTNIPREPSQIWNIHRFPHVNPDPKRFVNWKNRYNAAVAKGARVIGLEPMAGVNGVELLDTGTLKLASYWSLGCSVSIMVTKAALDGFDSILLFGVKLTDAEYRHTIAPILEGVKFARGRGIAVSVNPHGRESEWRKSFSVVDWTNIRDNYMPYWSRQWTSATSR